MLLEKLPYIGIDLILLVPSILPGMIFFFLAWRSRKISQINFYKMAMGSFVASLVSLWGIYGITIGPGSKDAQAAIGFFFLPPLSTVAGIIALAASKFFVRQPNLESKEYEDVKTSILWFPFIIIIICLVMLFDFGSGNVNGLIAQFSDNKQLLIQIEDEARTNNDTTTLLMLTQNSQTPPEVLERMSTYAPDYILIHISSNSNTPLHVLQKFAEQSEDKLLSDFAKKALLKRNQHLP